MDSVIRQILGTVLRGSIYRGMRRLPIGTILPLAIMAAIGLYLSNR